MNAPLLAIGPRLAMMSLLGFALLSPVGCETLGMGEPDSLTYACSEPLALNFHESFEWNEASAMVFSTLFMFGEDGEIQPDLVATSRSDSGQRIHEFTLRREVFWHDGTPLQAQEVVDSLLHFRNLISDEGAISSSKPPAPPWVTLQAPNESTLVVEVVDPKLPLQALLTRYPIIKVTDRELGSLKESQEPVLWIGTGPYRMMKPLEGPLRFRAHPVYHHGVPEVERIDLEVIADLRTRQTKLEQGAIDVAPLPIHNARELVKGSEQLRLHRVHTTSIHVLAFDHRKEPFRSTRLRRAFLHAIDWEGILEELFSGDAVSPTALWGDMQGVESSLHDPALARDLLIAEAPKDNSSWTVDFAVCPLAGNSRRCSEALRDFFAESGLLLRRHLCELQDPDAIQEALKSEYDAFAIKWDCPLPLDASLYAFFHSQGRFNIGGYHNPKLDGWLDDLLHAPISARGPLRERVWETVRAEVPLVPIARECKTYVTQEDLRGVEVPMTESGRTLTRWAYRWRWGA